MSPPTRARHRTRTSQKPFRFLSLGDSAITIEFGNDIDPEINARVVAFSQMVGEQGWNGILDIVPSYRSVTVQFDPLQWNSAVLTKKLKVSSMRFPSYMATSGDLT